MVKVKFRTVRREVLELDIDDRWARAALSAVIGATTHRRSLIIVQITIRDFAANFVSKLMLSTILLSKKFRPKEKVTD
jgi:hypothetical protein